MLQTLPDCSCNISVTGINLVQPFWNVLATHDVKLFRPIDVVKTINEFSSSIDLNLILDSMESGPDAIVCSLIN